MKFQSVFRLISQFPTNLAQLSSVLSRFEANAEAALVSLDAAKQSRFSVTPAKTSSYSAKTDEIVTADSTSGNVAVQLPIASAGNAGRPVGVLRVSSANTITVSAIGQTIDGAAADRVSIEVGLYLYYSTGIGWTRIKAQAFGVQPFASGTVDMLSTSAIIELDNSLANSTLNLCSPGVFAGRTALVCLAVNTSVHALTLHRYGTEKINQVAADKIFAGGVPMRVLVTSNGTDWWTSAMGAGS